MSLDQVEPRQAAATESAESLPWPEPEQGGPSPLVQLVLSRMREFFRQPEAIFWVYGFPIMMAVALGIAFRNRPQPVMVVDVVEAPGAALIAEALDTGEIDRGRVAQTSDPDAGAADATIELTQDATAMNKPRFDIRVDALEGARRRLRTGRTQLVVIPRAGIDRPTSLDELEFEYLYDPTRPEGALARAATDDALQRAAGRRDPVAVENVVMSEPGGRYIDFLIPGLLGASLMGGGLWGVGFVTVDMRVRNLLKRFITTPMKKSHFLLGLMISRFFFMVTEVLLLLAFAYLVFDVRVLGSFAVLLLFVVLGALTFAGVGLLVASRARTIETASGLMNLVMLPMWLLSGIFFSAERFPAVVQPLIKLLPLTPLIDAMRAVMIEGTPLAGLMSEAAILIAWGLASFFIALRWFRWY